MSRAGHLGRLTVQALLDRGVDRGEIVAAGELYIDSGDLHRLIGRPTTTLPEAIAVALP